MAEVCLGVVGLQEAKTHQLKLKEKKIEVELMSNDQTCSSGSCSVTVEIWAKEEDLPIIREYFASEFARNLGGLEINEKAINSVYDNSAAITTCQACGEEFSTSVNVCPSCGLVY